MSNQSLVPRYLKTSPTCIVIGNQGVGQTALFNKICQSSNVSKQGSESVTRDLDKRDVNVGNYKFCILDTPGVDAKKDAFRHVFLAREALTCTNLNTVFIMLKFENRYDDIVEQFTFTQAPIEFYSKNIAIIISHWDYVEEPEKTYQVLCQQLGALCKNIIFISKNDDADDVALAMYQVMSNLEPVKIDVKKEDFYFHFQITEGHLQIKQEFTKFKQELWDLQETYESILGELPQDNKIEKDQIIHMAIVEFKNETDDLFEKFRSQQQQNMDQLNFYAFGIKLQKQILRLNQDFSSKLSSLMSYNIFDRTDPHNWFQRCPNPDCQLIWMQIDGCPITTCGNNGWANPFDLIARPFWKYSFQREGQKLSWKQIEKQMLKLTGNTLVNEETSKVINVNQGQNTQKLGCNTPMDFTKLPAIEEHLIEEILKVKSKEELIKFMDFEAFQNARATVENEILRNSTFSFE